MSKVRFRYGGVVLCFCRVLFTAGAFGWEFALRSRSVFEYDFYNQQLYVIDSIRLDIFLLSKMSLSLTCERSSIK
jgi:hypothetical protein